jgi:uncharacterized Zn-binding protein involved in type VI secretion
MPGQGRLSDQAHADADAHGCPGCPHPTTGPAISGSPDVFVNARPALRVGDVGLHAPCCGPNQWRADTGSDTVFINGRPAHRIGDDTRHCGGPGALREGSNDVIVGGGKTRTGSPANASGDGKARGTVKFTLKDDAGLPLAGVRWRVRAPDGRVIEGRTDESGGARVDDLPPGKCRVSFPDGASDS